MSENLIQMNLIHQSIDDFMDILWVELTRNSRT